MELKEDPNKVSYTKLKKYYDNIRPPKPKGFPGYMNKPWTVGMRVPFFYEREKKLSDEAFDFFQNFMKIADKKIKLPDYWRKGDTLRIAFARNYDMKQVLSVRAY